MQILRPTLKGLITTICVTGAGPAFAEGPYIEMRGGITKAQPANATPHMIKQGSTGKGRSKGDVSPFDKHGGRSPEKIKGNGIPQAVFDFDKGWTGAVELGYQTNFNMRLGLELAYANLPFTNKVTNGSNTGKAKALTGFINAYFDLPSSARLTPYVGAGIGYTGIKLNDFQMRANSPVRKSRSGALAYQFIAGASYRLSPQWALTLDYRHMRTAGLALPDGGDVYGKIKLRSNSVFAGLRYSF